MGFYRLSKAQSSSWVRLWQPVLASKLAMWLSTVRGLSSKAAAIDLLEEPSSSCSSTFDSLRVIWSGFWPMAQRISLA